MQFLSSTKRYPAVSVRKGRFYPGKSGSLLQDHTCGPLNLNGRRTQITVSMAKVCIAVCFSELMGRTDIKTIVFSPNTHRHACMHRSMHYIATLYNAIWIIFHFLYPCCWISHCSFYGKHPSLLSPCYSSPPWGSCDLSVSILRLMSPPNQGGQVLMWFSPAFFFLLIIWHHLAGWTTVLCCCSPSKIPVSKKLPVTAGLVATSCVYEFSLSQLGCTVSLAVPFSVFLAFRVHNFLYFQAPSSPSPPYIHTNSTWILDTIPRLPLCLQRVMNSVYTACKLFCALEFRIGLCAWFVSIFLDRNCLMDYLVINEDTIKDCFFTRLCWHISRQLKNLKINLKKTPKKTLMSGFDRILNVNHCLAAPLKLFIGIFKVQDGERKCCWLPCLPCQLSP